MVVRSLQNRRLVTHVGVDDSHAAVMLTVEGETETIEKRRERFN